MNGKKYIKEQTILYLFKIMITAIFSLVMYYVWTKYYNAKAPTPFYRLGNYLLLVLFVVIYVAFVKVYGGFMVGTATVIDLIFSQTIAIMFMQGVCYIIFSLISYRLVAPWPFLALFAAFSVFAAGSVIRASSIARIVCSETATTLVIAFSASAVRS